MIRRFFAILIVTVLLLALAAPAIYAQDTTTVTYWHTMSDAETAALEEQIAAFEAEHPGINIEATGYAYDDFKEALLTAIAGGEPPDVARLDILWVPEFADLGVLAPMDETLPDFDTLKGNFFPGPLQTNYWNGHYWGIPQDTNTQVLLYNKAEFDAAGLDVPQTAADFATDACALTNGDQQYGYAMGGTYFWASAPLFYAMGGKITDAEATTATGYLNSDASVAAFQSLVDLYNNGCISPSLLGGGTGTAEGHATGLYSMIIDGPWMVDIYKNDFPDFEVNFAPVPAGADGATSSVVGGENVVLFSDSPNKDAAVEWVSYITSEDFQLAMAQVGQMPVLNSLSGNQALPPYFNVFLRQLETAQARTPTPHWDEIDNAINNAYQSMLRGEKTVRQALDDATDKVNALLAQ